MDDKVFDSITRSSRRIHEIKVNIKYELRIAAGERVVFIVEKFKKNLKRVVVSEFPVARHGVFARFLDAACGVEELLLLEVELKPGDEENTLLLLNRPYLHLRRQF